VSEINETAVGRKIARAHGAAGESVSENLNGQRGGRVTIRGKPRGKPSFFWLVVIAPAAAAALFFAFEVTPHIRDHGASALAAQPSGGYRSAPVFSPNNLSASMSSSRLKSRPLFPYSIIPGGAEGAQALRNAEAHDPVVASHYAGFNLVKAHVIRVDRDRMVYVSYRRGSNVFWTRHTLRLFKGETLLSDGQHEARTRCGNRVSEIPAAPVAYEEPRPEEFETPNDPDPFVFSSPPVDLPLTAPPTTDIQSPEPGGGFFVPPVVPVVWGPGDPSKPAPPVPPAPVATPEPGTLLLFSTGICAAWLLKKKRKT
jgi:hypothetical protein